MLQFPIALLALVHFCENFNKVLTGIRISDGSTCQLFAFLSICSIVTMMGCLVAVAYASHQVVAQGQLCSSTRRVVVFGSALSWLAGLVVGGGYQATGMLGPYANLYCCVRDEGMTRAPILVTVVIFFVAAIAQFQYYCRIYIKLHSSEAWGRRITGSLREVVAWGLQNILLFYVGWIRLTINSMHAYSGQDIDQWIIIPAAWLAKVQLFLCGLSFLHQINLIKKQEGASAKFVMRKGAVVANGIQAKDTPAAVHSETDADGSQARKAPVHPASVADEEEQKLDQEVTTSCKVRRVCSTTNLLGETS